MSIFKKFREGYQSKHSSVDKTLTIIINDNNLIFLSIIIIIELKILN